MLVLGAVGIVAALAGALATWNQGPEFGPKYYPILLVITALPDVETTTKVRRIAGTEGA